MKLLIRIGTAACPPFTPSLDAKVIKCAHIYDITALAAVWRIILLFLVRGRLGADNEGDNRLVVLGY